jgi:hypothetical protein
VVCVDRFIVDACDGNGAECFRRDVEGGLEDGEIPDEA